LFGVFGGAGIGDATLKPFPVVTRIGAPGGARSASGSRGASVR